MSGMLALAGGGPSEPGHRLAAALLGASGSTEVLVVPAAAAYEHPEAAVDRVRACFEPLGATVTGLDLVQRSDAHEPGAVAAVEQAAFVYLTDGSALHLRSVLKGSPVLEALRQAWSSGAAVVGSGAGAVALCDPMLDPRGGALTMGLGLVVGVTILPGSDAAAALDEHRRTLELAEPDVCVVAVPEGTALIRGAEGTWSTDGDGTVAVFVGGAQVGLDALP